jgi:hypothetical protein
MARILKGTEDKYEDSKLKLKARSCSTTGEGTVADLFNNGVHKVTRSYGCKTLPGKYDLAV